MSVVQVLAFVVIGWPGVIASSMLAIVGIRKARAALVAAGAALGTPFLLYMSGMPDLRTTAPVVLVLYWASALAVFAEKRLLAAALFVPFLLVAAYVALLVMS